MKKLLITTILINTSLALAVVQDFPLAALDDIRKDRKPLPATSFILSENSQNMSTENQFFPIESWENFFKRIMVDF